MKTRQMSLDKTSIRDAPDNGFFQYYLQKSGTKKYGGHKRGFSERGGETRPADTTMALKAADP